MSRKLRDDSAEQDPRLRAATETNELTHGGTFVDGKLVHDTKPRTAEQEADRGGKTV